MKPRPDCLQFPEQQISIVVQQRKVTSRLPHHIANVIHGPKLTNYLSEKEKLMPLVFRSITWDSFKIAVNKLTTARQIITSKTLYSLWCTNTRHKRDRGQHKECCFCGHEDEDWRHVLTCEGTGKIIFHTGSWSQLRTSTNKWEIHRDIWTCFEHGLSHFFRHPHKDDTSHPTPPFGPSLRANHVILNNTAATQSHTGWPNFLKGQISNEWAKLWTKYMGLPTAKSCERALIQSLWDHIYCVWTFQNNEDHKNDNRVVAQYKQQALDISIGQQYSVFHTQNLPLNPIQQRHFDIPQDELILLSYNIRHAWLRSADLYISRATAYNNLA
jgi:hypothetical protein